MYTVCLCWAISDYRRHDLLSTLCVVSAIISENMSPKYRLSHSVLRPRGFWHRCRELLLWLANLLGPNKPKQTTSRCSCAAGRDTTKKVLILTNTQTPSPRTESDFSWRLTVNSWLLWSRSPSASLFIIINHVLPTMIKSKLVFIKKRIKFANCYQTTSVKVKCKFKLKFQIYSCFVCNNSANEGT